MISFWILFVKKLIKILGSDQDKQIEKIGKDILDISSQSVKNYLKKLQKMILLRNSQKVFYVLQIGN